MRVYVYMRCIGARLLSISRQVLEGRPGCIYTRAYAKTMKVREFPRQEINEFLGSHTRFLRNVASMYMYV